MTATTKHDRQKLIRIIDRGVRILEKVRDDERTAIIAKVMEERIERPTGAKILRIPQEDFRTKTREEAKADLSVWWPPYKVHKLHEAYRHTGAFEGTIDRGKQMLVSLRFTGSADVNDNTKRDTVELTDDDVRLVQSLENLNG